MNETRHWNILFLHPLLSGILSQSILLLEICHLSRVLQINRHTLIGISILRCCLHLWRITSNDSIVRTTCRTLLLIVSLLIKLLALCLCTATSLLFILLCFLCFLRFKSKLLCLNLLFRHRYFTEETEAITVIEEHMLIIISIPILLQNGWNLFFTITITEWLWMRDIGIIGNTTILSDLLMIQRKEQMCLIAFT